MPDAVNTVVCAPDDGWKYHPKHLEQFPNINKLCDVASCWIYEYIGILLEAHPILHINRIKVNSFESNFIPVAKCVKLGVPYSGKKMESQIQFRTVVEPEKMK
jgi:hypothetical protein